MLILSERDVAHLMTTAEAVDLLEGALRAQAAGTARSIPRSRVRDGSFVLHVLPAADSTSHLGVKVYLSGQSPVRFVYLLFGPAGPEAMIAADGLGRMRTGAASGLATKYLAASNARHLVVIGTGNQALSQIEAVVSVRAIERVTICGRDPGRLEHFVAAVKSAHSTIDVKGSSDVARAAASADVLTTITSSPEPVFDGHDLPDSIHINAAGSNRSTHREIDDETLRRTSFIVTDDIAQARTEAGDLLRCAHFDWNRVHPLSAILTAAPLARGAVSLFESLGIGLWDLALATEIVYRARVQGRGQEQDLADFFAAP